jgi:hypothetical protein
VKTKIIFLPGRHAAAQSDEETANERLSVAECREILQEEGKELSDARIIEIRDYLYRLAAITWEEYQYRQHEKAKLINIEQHKPSDNEKSDYLRTG